MCLTSAQINFTHTPRSIVHDDVLCIEIDSILIEINNNRFYDRRTLHNWLNSSKESLSLKVRRRERMDKLWIFFASLWVSTKNKPSWSINFNYFLLRTAKFLKAEERTKALRLKYFIAHHNVIVSQRNGNLRF